MTDPLLTGIFAVAAIAGIALGIASFVRPSRRLRDLAAGAGVGWLVVFGAIVIAHLSDPVEQVGSVVVVAALGALAGLVSYRTTT